MKKTPKSLRLQIGIFGRTNVGKSSFLNLVTAQDVSITSPIPGTTTDVVEKTMELLPLGPVVFLDTGGIDDISTLAQLRIKKTKKIFDRADFILLIVEPEIWTESEENIYREAQERNTPFIIIVNKTDIREPSTDFIKKVNAITNKVVFGSSIDKEERDVFVNAVKKCLIELVPPGFLNPPALIGDLMPSGGLAALIIPIDLEAPKGRLILPQVQTIRDALDNDSAVLVVKEREYKHLLDRFKIKPDIVVCDSQVVLKMTADTPKDINCTTFSILFARYKGDLIEMAKGAAVIDKLKPGDKVLIAETCSHHAIEDDIGRVKIPRWIRQYTGADIKIDITSGRDYPDNLKEYKLVVHCGSCMITRKEMLLRLQYAKDAGVSITNYGICISFLQGVLERVLSPFPAALEAYNKENKKYTRSKT
ncbi:MAG: [FeFe] hydrogenase H-cluster maturation GTPase HydF [Candidatus Omnitrophica bacterium]|nr:[FeFe] hydrogenase H-cluster maturation GTPase HydF [Candidatus Omnitrophota bacterium]MBU4478586.1 [FeFe] hydrogenase H-cluster maturation GTPase HydF [Candidatus Omnitrophota bacterium]